MVKEIVFYVIFAGVLLTLLIYGIKIFLSETKKAIVKTGFIMNVQCKKCGYKHQMEVQDYPFGGMVKSKGVTKTKIEGVMIVNLPTYSSYAKKIHCLQCGDKQWTEVLNINEYNSQFRGLVIKNMIIFTVVMLTALNVLSKLIFMPLSKILF